MGCAGGKELSTTDVDVDVAPEPSNKAEPRQTAEALDELESALEDQRETPQQRNTPVKEGGQTGAEPDELPSEGSGAAGESSTKVRFAGDGALGEGSARPSKRPMRKAGSLTALIRGRRDTAAVHDWSMRAMVGKAFNAVGRASRKSSRGLHESSQEYDKNATEVTVTRATADVSLGCNLELAADSDACLVISSITKGSVCDGKDGLRMGDRLERVNGKPVAEIDEVIAAVAGQLELRFTVLRRKSQHSSRSSANRGSVAL